VAWSDLLAAFALYLVLEGIIPFASPSGWREAINSLARMTDEKLRVFGLSIMLVGLVLLFLVRG
jgi:uncharacterized protein YjeT (DUF2065 family)